MINIKNENDNECFRCCHLAYLFPDEINPQRISKYKKYTNKVKYDGIDFPVKIKDIPKNENHNDDIRLNVYGVTKDQTIYPLYNSNKICDKTCNLILIENGNENHYVWIKDFNKLMNSQSKDGHRLFFVIIVYNILQQFYKNNNFLSVVNSSIQHPDIQYFKP